MDALGGEMVDLHPPGRDQLCRRTAAAAEHRRKHRIQPQGGDGRRLQRPLRLWERRKGIRLNGRGGKIGAARLTQLLTDELRCRFQRESGGRTI